MDKSEHPVVWRKIEDLTLWEDNPRKISKAELDRLKRSLERDPDFMQAMPIVLSDRTGKLVIISGNQRYKGCKELGWKEVPTVLFHCKTEEEEVRKAMIANHNNGDWDTQLLANKFANYPLEEWLGSDWEALSGDFAKLEQKEVEEDEVPEVTEEEASGIKQGDIFILGGHKLMCGDATKKEDVQKLAGGGRLMIDLWLTDPPYNVAYEGGTDEKLTIMNDNMDDASFAEFLNHAFDAAESVMKPGAAFYIFYASSESYNFHGACRHAGLKVREELIWVKNSLVLGRQDYQWRHEPCCYGWKDGGSHYFVYDRSLSTVNEEAELDPDKMDEEELRKEVKKMLALPSTVQRYDKPNRNELHPTEKPVKLVSYLITNSTKPNANVLDTFGGSGTTLIACEQLGRHCYMMELDPKYCARIIKRWEKLTGEKAEKVK